MTLPTLKLCLIGLAVAQGVVFKRSSARLIASTSAAGTAVERHGSLRVEGNAIVDKAGQPVRLRGMSLFWSQWKPQFYTADVARWLQEDWHVTLVRAAMAVDQGGYLENPAGEKAKLEAVVQGCIDAGIYVIIDWHDHHAETHLNEAKAFFDEMAQKYGHYENVIFEPYNEPLGIDWASEIKPYHEEVVSVIRRHTNNLIILGTRTWSQEVDEASRNPVAGENLAYTLHFYASTHGASLREKALTALNNGVPIFATEWGTCDASGNGALNFQETQLWLDFFAQHHISDANWAIGDKSESCAALAPGASGSGGWPLDQLTESGAWVRNSLRTDAGESEAGTPEATTETTTSIQASTTTTTRSTTTTTTVVTTTTTTIVTTSTAETTAHSPATTAAPVPSSSLAQAWGQCGGSEWQGPTQCAVGYTCERQSDFYSQCLPPSSSSETVSTLAPSTAATTAPGSSSSTSAAHIAQAWSQCGGSQGNPWQGPKECVAGYTCEMESEFYSQCLPASSSGATDSTSHAAAFAKCGGLNADGSNWDGPSQCTAGYACTRQGDWYSQCLPISSASLLSRKRLALNTPRHIQE